MAMSELSVLVRWRPSPNHRASTGSLRRGPERRGRAARDQSRTEGSGDAAAWRRAAGRMAAGGGGGSFSVSARLSLAASVSTRLHPTSPCVRPANRPPCVSLHLRFSVQRIVHGVFSPRLLLQLGHRMGRGPRLLGAPTGPAHRDYFSSATCRLAVRLDPGAPRLRHVSAAGFIPCFRSAYYTSGVTHVHM